MLTAEENVVLPLSIAGEQPDATWLEELPGRIGLADRRKHCPSELSGAQPRRVEIGRALVSKPTIVLADWQPRLDDERGDPGLDAPVGRRLRPDDGDGDARGCSP